jgi:AbrB family looped-hinge helix DNA binding protein
LLHLSKLGVEGYGDITILIFPHTKVRKEVLSNTLEFGINVVGVMVKVVSVTQKGQATIPKALRDKFRVKGKVLVVETSEGILFKPLPRPEDDFGSLKQHFKGEVARKVLDEARSRDRLREKRLLEKIRD